MPHRHPIFALTVVLIALCSGPTPSAAQPLGQWSTVAPLPFFPIHTHLLPTGKVMFWPGDGGVSGNDPRSWDPANQSVSILTKPGFDLFCSGHSFLADGTLFVAGGHISNNVGLKRASIYNPFTNAWSSPPLPDMNAGRWYPTTTVLGNGDVLVVSGDIDLTVGVNTLPQVFQRSTGTWRSLTNAQLAQDLYPWMLLAPNGKIFNAGPTGTTRYLDTSGTGAWSVVANRVVNIHRNYGSAVMYAPGKVLVMGGGLNPPTETAEVIDLNAPSPSWRAVGSMQFARRQLNATLLPDGTVLVTGGTAAPGFNDPSGAVHAAELWDPATEGWTTLASSSGIPRVYHSSALLLQDGRVLSMGGNGYPDTEIYSPPYLFNGARPAITSAPPSVAYGQSFFVGTPDAATISKVTMLSLSSVTHAFNQSQYIN
ncbi:MAG: galactose oxidase-like domain-containing protein, partial [Polaromonas sp.]